MKDAREKQSAKLPLGIAIFAAVSLCIASGAIVLYIGVFWRMFG